MSFFDSFAFASSRRGTKAKRKRFQLEALEPRVVLTSNVEITEFQASNINTLFDEDEDSSDWIELQNTSLETVNLSGWFLTDLKQRHIAAAAYLRQQCAARRDRDRRRDRRRGRRNRRGRRSRRRSPRPFEIERWQRRVGRRIDPKVEAGRHLGRDLAELR